MREVQQSTSPVVSPPLLTSDDWCTPKDLAEDLGSFDLDPCSNPRSHIQATRKICLPEDGLTAEWDLNPDEMRYISVFCNPPYSNVGPWATRLMNHDGPWIALVKLDPTTKWWRTFQGGNRVQWAPFRYRIRFERPDKPPLTANFPAALIWYARELPKAVQERVWMPSVQHKRP